MSMRARLFLGALVTLNVVLHLPDLTDPPLGHHAWRQADTAAIARNYLEIDAAFLHPRIDYLHNESGISPGELPLYPYAVSLGYRVVGANEVVARALTLLCSCVAILALFTIGTRCVDATFGLAAAFVLSFSPVFFHYGRNIQPDVPMIAVALGGVALLAGGRARGWRAVAGMVALAAAPMIKPGVVALTAPAAFGTRRCGVRAGWVLLACVPAVVWYAFTAHQVQSYGGERYFGTFLYEFASAPGATFVQHLTSWRFARAVWRGVRTAWLGHAGALLLLVGVVQWRTLPRPLQSALIAAIGIATLWLIALGPPLRAHDYYALPLIPALALIAAHGATALWNASPARRALAVGLLLALPFAALSYSAPLRTGNVHPAFVGIERMLDRVVPRDARILIGPDETPGVALYHAHRRGWSFPYATRTLTMDDLVARGARYLVSADDTFEHAPEMARHLGGLIATSDGVRVYRLR